MGFLTFWKKDNKQDQEHDKEEVMYRTLLIKKLIDDVEELKRKCHSLEEDLKEVKKKKTENKTRAESDKPQTIEQLSKLTGVKLESLRVYLSRIRSKGYIIEFNN
jgi:tRNA U34 5-carboxymethylaminomethyl modifying enzyme MnmG/GidA